MRHFHHMRRSQSGYSLVELLTVMAIISTLMMAGYTLVSNVLSTQLKTLNQFILIQESSNINAYLFEAGYNLTVDDLAPNQQNSATVPAVALAGDQLSWCYNLSNNNERWCTRIFYVARWQRVYRIKAPEQIYGSIAPVRGPNQMLPPRGDCVAPCFVAAPGSPLRDRVLDKLYQGRPGANRIADKVSLEQAGDISPTITNATAPFRYFDGGRQRLAFIPAQADSSTPPMTISQKAAIEEVQFDFYLQPVLTGSWAEIDPLHYLYEMSV
jgi:prepilin-type N-terminal cleavage/methylation domain-containing protein